AGSTGQCLVSGSTGSPTWQNCGFGVNYFTSTNGAIYPINSTLDLLVGGNSTAAAKFAFINVNFGTPTASISAGVNGSTYLTADGNLSTTARQTLALGNSATGGNITLNPLSFVKVNGALNVTGTTTLSSLSTGVVHSDTNGVLSSSAVNLASAD